MLIAGISLRLLCREELVGDPCPEACVEVAFEAMGPFSAPETVMFPEPVRITPAALARLRIESERTLGDIRAEVVRAEIAWKRRLGCFHREGRRAVEARVPDTALLERVLDGLRNLDPARA